MQMTPLMFLRAQGPDILDYKQPVYNNTQPVDGCAVSAPPAGSLFVQPTEMISTLRADSSRITGWARFAL